MSKKKTKGSCNNVKQTVSEMTDLQKQTFINELLNQGLSITQVSRHTGLSEEVVSDARDTYKKYIVK